MPLATATITFDLADMLGEDFDTRRTKVWVTTNVPDDVVVDTVGNQIRLGSGNVTLLPDGTGSFTVWVPSADSNPTSWQTYVHVDYPDRAKPKGRETTIFGPFTITASANLADLVDEQAIPPDFSGAGFIAEVEAIRDQQKSLAAIDDTDSAVHYNMVYGTMTAPYLSANFARKDSAPLSVTEYGAVADWNGITGTDNLAAFQAAIAAASDGQRVYVPAGRYYLSGTLTIDKVIDFDCAAGGIMENTLGTQLTFAAGQSGLIVQAGGAGWRVGPFNIDSESTAAGTDVGLFAGGPNSGGGIIDRVTTNGFGSHGIHLKAGATYGGGNVNNSVLNRVRSTYNRGDGIRLEGSDANACHLIKPDVVGNYGWGINLEDSAQTVVEHPHADQQYNGAPGAYRDDGNSNDWRWIYSEGSEKITFDTGCAYSRMSQGQYGAAVVEKLTANNITINDTYLGDYYRRDIYGASAHTWRMSSDVYSPAHFALTYQSGSAGAAKNYMVVSRNLDKFLLFAKVDPNADGTLDLGSSSLRWRNGFFSSYVRVGAVATGSRPAASTAGAGAHMFDTTLGKPIWSNGTNWVDATGAVV